MQLHLNRHLPTHRRVPALAVAAALVLTLLPTGAGAQQAPQVQGLKVVQQHGYATLSWTPVQGATAYQIERTPVTADDVAAGAAVIVGVWQPNRTTTQSAPTFADAGFNPGDRFRWRVRVKGNTLGLPDLPAEPPVDLPTNAPWSAPAFGTTLAPFGAPGTPGAGLRTGWETSLAAQYTGDTDEYAYTAGLDAASERVRVVEIGRSVQDRPINMFVIGHPAPPATAAEIADSPTVMVNCNVHGNEPSSREACFILARELAFATDPRTVDVLSNMTVLLVPSINADGRAANTRGNSTGQDLNRDYSLIRQPETMALVRAVRDYSPEAAFDGHEFGNNSAGDLPVLPPRHLNVAQSIFDESQRMIEGWMYSSGAADGWWFCPYGCDSGGSVGLSEETILRNTLGLKNTVASLLETRSGGGPTRPNEAGTQENRRRKTYSAIYTYQRFFDWYRANQEAVSKAIDESIAFQTSNTGRIVFRGSRPIQAYPAPHPGSSPPPRQDPAADQILETPPCGYLLTTDQYRGARSDGPSGKVTTVEQRLEAHGIAVEDRADGHLVRLAQPQRGLIPLLLDAQAAEELVGAQRVDTC